MTMLPFLMSMSSNRRLQTSDARMPCLYATKIMAHSRLPLALAALSTERTSAGSRLIIELLVCLCVCRDKIDVFFGKCNIMTKISFLGRALSGLFCIRAKSRMQQSG